MSVSIDLWRRTEDRTCPDSYRFAPSGEYRDEKPPPLIRRPYVQQWRRICDECGEEFIRAFPDDHCDGCLKKNPMLRWVDDEDGGAFAMPKGKAHKKTG